MTSRWRACGAQLSTSPSDAAAWTFSRYSLPSASQEAPWRPPPNERFPSGAYEAFAHGLGSD
jgi:hypothetical protein